MMSSAGLSSRPTGSSIQLEKATLGTLINIAGRQRMLSHRVVMFLALGLADTSKATRLRHIEAAEHALVDFTKGRGTLLSGDSARSLPPLFSGRAKALFDSSVEARSDGRTGLGLIDHFIAIARTCVERAKFSKADGGDPELQTLSQLASETLLAFLNRLVAAFEADLADANAREIHKATEIRRLILSTVNDIEKLGASINLIAMSAVVEAGRAGPAGQTFAIIANEIKTLSSRARAEAAKIGSTVSLMFEAG